LSERFRVLLVEDNPGDAALVGDLLSEGGPVEFEVERAPRLATAVERVTEDHFDGILLDLGLPDSTGIDTVRAMRQAAAELPIVVITGNGDEQTGMATIREGAQDYVVKGMVSAATLSRVLHYAMERNQSARRLRESESLLEEVGAMAHVGGWEVDLKTERVHWTRETYRIHEVSEDEHLDLLDAVLFYDLPDRFLLEAALQRCKEDGEPFDLELAFTSAKGRHVWTRVIGRAVNVDGKLEKLMGTFQDITERKRMEESLRRTQFSVDHSGDLIHWLNPEGHFVYVNDSTCRRLGFGRDELLSMSIFDVDPNAPQPWSSRFREIKKRGCLVFESLRQTRDREIFPVEVTANYFSYEGQEYCCAFVRDISERKTAQEELRQGADRLARLVDGTINALSRLAERRDPYTAGHQQSVARLSCAIGAHMGLAPEDIEGLRVAAVLHDIGKVAVPIEILSKPGAISASEMDIVKTHPEVGYQILKDIEFPWPVAQIVRQHHERMDGSGYPRGTAGADIFAVADTVEAMSSHRPYRPALGLDAALTEVRRRNGAFDRKVVRACVTVFESGDFFLDAALRLNAPGRRPRISAHAAKPPLTGGSPGRASSRAAS
jgi:PAS domain S-box-containing protein/putative nucleotidyltransferase with HDIG domain